MTTEAGEQALPITVDTDQERMTEPALEDRGTTQRDRLWRVTGLVAGGVFACGLSLVAAWRYLGYTRESLSSWIGVNGDAANVEALATIAGEHSWIGYPIQSDRFGWPFGEFGQYYPTADWLHVYVIKALMSVGASVGTALNVYLLLAFPLTVLTSAWLLRRVGTPWLLTWTMATAFSLLPYHFFRSVGHFFLAQLWTIPLGLLAIVLALQVGARSTRILIDEDAKSGRWKELLLAVGLSGMVGFAGIYYSFFTLLAWMPAVVLLVYKAARGRDWRPLVWLAAPTALFGGLMVSLLPSVLYVANNPPLGDVSTRSTSESLMYTGTLWEFLSPWVHVIGELPQGYVPSEEGYGSGLVGGLAMVTAIGLAFWSIARSPRMATTDHQVLVWSSIVTLWLLGWYLRGGFGFLFATVVSPQIRAYGRLVPVIVLTGLVAVGVVVGRSVLGKRRRLTLTVAATSAIAALATVQYLAMDPPPLNAVQAAALRQVTTDYTEDLRGSLGSDCPVIQAPLVPWPEGARASEMGYDGHWEVPLAVPNSGQWSFGAVRNTDDAAWQSGAYYEDARSVAYLGAAMDFCAISVDLRGYPDMALAQQDLTQLLGSPIAQADHGVLVAYSLGQLDVRELDRLGDASFAEAEEYLLAPVFAGAFDVNAGAAVGSTESFAFQPDETTTRLRLTNLGDDARRVRLNVGTGTPDVSVTLSADSERANGSIELDIPAAGFVDVAVGMAGSFGSAAPEPVLPGLEVSLEVRDGWTATPVGLAPQNW